MPAACATSFTVQVFFYFIDGDLDCPNFRNYEIDKYWDCPRGVGGKTHFKGSHRIQPRRLDTVLYLDHGDDGLKRRGIAGDVIILPAVGEIDMTRSVSNRDR